MKVTRTQLRSQLERQLIEHISIKQMNEAAIELYPYFKKAILAERADLRTYMLLEGHYDLYESMAKEDKLLNEGFLDTVADIGITAGQMIGGGVGQAAGVAGLIKYTPEFQNNIDKPFMDWFFPFISVFFSAQALLFPMPAAGTMKGILQGFAKGVKNIISGAGGLLAKGAMAALTKGKGFFIGAVNLFKKAAIGMAKMVAKGGDDVAKLEAKLGGSGFLSKVMKTLKGAIEEFVKRLGVLVEGLKSLGKTNVKDAPALVKNILKKAFETSKDKLDDAAAALKGTKIGKAIAAAKTKAGRALEKALLGVTVKASDDIAKLAIKGGQLKGMGTTSAQISGIVGGRLSMNYLDDAGKIIYTSAISGDDLVKILAKNPKVKKWMLSNLDDAGRKVASKALSTASSTSKAAAVAAAKVTSKASKQVLKSLGKNIWKASAGGRASLVKYLDEFMAANIALMDDLVKPLVGKNYGQLGVFKEFTGKSFKFAAPPGEVLGGVVRGAATVNKSGRAAYVSIKNILAGGIKDGKATRMFGNFIRDLSVIKDPAMDIILAAIIKFAPAMAKKAGPEAARILAASQGGGFDDFDAEAYKSPIRSNRRKLPGEEGYKSVSDKLGSVVATGLDESLYLEELIWESNLRRKMFKGQKLINLIH